MPYQPKSVNGSFVSLSSKIRLQCLSILTVLPVPESPNTVLALSYALHCLPMSYVKHMLYLLPPLQ